MISFNTFTYTNRLLNQAATFTANALYKGAKASKKLLIQASESFVYHNKGNQVFNGAHLLDGRNHIHETATRLYSDSNKFNSVAVASHLEMLFGEIIEVTNERIEAASTDKERTQVIDMMQLISSEILTKVLGSYTPEGMINRMFSFPVINREGMIELQGFRMEFAGDLHFDDMRKDVNQPYFFLKPEGEKADQHASILIFSPTNYNSKSILANLSTTGPGYELYRKSKETLDQLLETVDVFRVMGYSQGSSIAEYTFVDYFDKVSNDSREPSYAFASPNLTPKYSYKLAKREAASGLFKSNNLRTIFNQYDVVSHINWPVGKVWVMENTQKKVSNPLTAHTGLKSTDTEFEVYNLNQSELKKISRRLLASFSN